jgi:pimeloyl-ACP methyl ester carboxylesterase
LIAHEYKSYRTRTAHLARAITFMRRRFFMPRRPLHHFALVALFTVTVPFAQGEAQSQTRQPSAATATAAAARAHRFSERHVTSADGTSIVYLTAGSGRPLVMVHGSMTVADEWLTVADGLAATRRVVVIERRGRGRSGDAVAHSLDVEARDLAAVVADVVRSTHSANQNADTSRAPLDLLGHSYGGAIVGRYAMDSAFSGAVVLYDPGAGFGGPIAIGQRAPVRALLAAGARDSALVLALSSIMSLPAANIAAMHANVALWTQFRTLLPSWIREFESLDTFAPSVAELGRIRGRTVILLGDRSGPLLRDITGTWVSRQPGVAVLPLRAQGHTGYLDAPAYLTRQIQTALSRNAAN